MTSRPFYNTKAILSLNALSLALGFESELLAELARNADKYYRLAKPITKPDGTIRQPFDATEPLKEVHRRIKDRILCHLSFPYYLTGSLKGTSYRVNAELHAGARIVICEDIEGFFPATSATVVFDVWRHLCGFSEDVARQLTALTTKEGVLPQGAITSSYLANLAFWRYEPLLHDALLSQGIQYSRYVDDLTVSSKGFLSAPRQTEIIAQLYGMLRKLGYRAKRRKHEVFTSRRQMRTTKLVMNCRPALSRGERAAIRVAVFQLEQRVASGDAGEDLCKVLNSVAGRVGKLKSFHEHQGASLMQRVRSIRAALNCSGHHKSQSAG